MALLIRNTCGAFELIWTATLQQQSNTNAQVGTSNDMLQ